MLYDLRSPLQDEPWRDLNQALGKMTWWLRGPGWSALCMQEKRRLGSYLYVPYGPVCANEAALSEALRAVTQLARTQRALWVRLEPRPPTIAADDDLAAWREAAPHVDVLVGSTTREAALFAAGVPALLSPMRHPRRTRHVDRFFVTPFTRRIYSRGAKGFARRHAQAGGTGWRYEFSWGVGRNPVAAAHISELPLLFPGHGAWERTPLTEGHTWAQVVDDGARLRRVWAGFARGEAPASDPRAGLRVFPPTDQVPEA